MGLKRSGRSSTGPPTGEHHPPPRCLHTICEIFPTLFDSKIFWHFNPIAQTAFAFADEQVPTIFFRRAKIFLVGTIATMRKTNFPTYFIGQVCDIIRSIKRIATISKLLPASPSPHRSPLSFVPFCSKPAQSTPQKPTS
jgi:hypothetical protein